MSHPYSASTTTKTANLSPSTNGRCRPKKRTPETVCPKPTGAMRSTTCCTCPLPKPSATTTTSTATVPPPSCPTADRSTTCITAAATCTKSASTTKSSPTSNAISCTAKSTAHRVSSPAATNLTL